MLFRPLLAHKCVEASQLLANSFIHHEPLAVHLKLDETAFAKWVSHVIQQSIKENLVFVAMDKSNQEIKGVMVAESMKNELNHSQLYPDAMPIFQMLHDLYKTSDHKFVNLDTSAHVFLVATKSNATRQGICYQLANYGLKCIKNQGYTDVYTELTAPGTQHIFINKLGFKPVNTIVFNDYSGTTFKDCVGKVVLAHQELRA